MVPRRLWRLAAISPVIPRSAFARSARARCSGWRRTIGSLAPGKRPRTTLSPTMRCATASRIRLGFAWRRPRPVDHAVLPAPRPEDESAGGDRRAGWHSEHFPISFWPHLRPGDGMVENRVPKATVDELKRRGTSSKRSDWSEGRLTATQGRSAPAPPIRGACRVTQRTLMK
jgi:gamma-glutamyltranspeptidase/glutathione hydrolase